MTVSLLLDRRASRDPTLCLRCGTIAVWPALYVAFVGDLRVALTKGESAMLLTMVAAGGEPVSRVMLGAACGRGQRRAGDRAVDMRISLLRKKLADNARAPQLIVTVSGVGYAIRVDALGDGTQERQSRYAQGGGTPRTGVA